tara:strand:- start:77 stop:478 length:402 start_codon:yes stop_codon:yes gene_type:complete
MKKILGIAVIGCFLSSCAPSEKSIHDARMKYMYQMPYELCMNYLSLPDWNQWQQYRAEAISKRKIDCSPWQEEAYALKQKKSDELWDSAGEVLDAVIDDAYNVPPKSENGKKMVCTTQQIGTSGMAKTTCREK